MADPEAIYNWRRLDDRITTSGQPTEKQPRRSGRPFAAALPGTAAIDDPLP